MSPPHLRRPAGVARMLKAQAHQAKGPSLRALVEANDANRAADAAQRALSEDPSGFVATTWPRLLQHALKKGHFNAFFALALDLYDHGRRPTLPPQTMAWVIKAMDSYPDFLFLTHSKPDAVYHLADALLDIPQTFTAVDWIRHAKQGMPLATSHEFSKNPSYQAQWVAFLSTRKNQEKLIAALLDSTLEDSSTGAKHQCLVEALDQVPEATQQALFERLADHLCARLERVNTYSFDGSALVRGLAQWVKQVRLMGKALDHPIHQALSEYLIAHPEVPSNASHQTGAWGLLSGLWACNRGLPAPKGFAEAWTPEAAERHGKRLGEGLFKHIHPEHMEDSFTPTRLQARAQALLNEVCMFEIAMRDWSVHTEAHHQAFLAGVEAAVPQVAAWLTGAPLDPAWARDRDSETTWRQTNSLIHQEWSQAHKAFLLNQRLPAPTPRHTPRF